MASSESKVRLRAVDAEDLAVIAAFLQDARVALREMVFEPEARRFVAVFTRYRRELQEDPTSCEGLTEIQAALVVEDVAEVKHRGLDTADLGRERSLLTVATQPGRDHLIHIDLVFEGDADIQLRTGRIVARLDDFGDAVPCVSTPCDHFAEALPGWTEPYGEPRQG